MKLKEGHKKYRLSNGALNYLASALDVGGSEIVLYHKLNRCFFAPARTFGFPTAVTLTTSEVNTLKILIESRLSGQHYISISDKELLKEALNKLKTAGES